MYKYDEYAIEKALENISIECVFQDELPEYLYTVNDILCFGFPEECAEDVMDYILECLSVLGDEIIEQEAYGYKNQVFINAHHSICAVSLEIIDDYKKDIGYMKRYIEQVVNLFQP